MMLEQILANVRRRLQELRPVVDEHERLTRALELLEAEFGPVPRPRPKPRPKSRLEERVEEVQAQLRTKGRRRRQRRERAAVRLEVLSSTKPTAAELADRKVAWTTEEPA